MVKIRELSPSPPSSFDALNALLLEAELKLGIDPLGGDHVDPHPLALLPVETVEGIGMVLVVERAGVGEPARGLARRIQRQDCGGGATWRLWTLNV